MNIDDSKIISKYEDLSKDFLVVGAKSVYMNAMKELYSTSKNKAELEELVKQFFLASYFNNTGQYVKAEEILKKTISKNGLGYFLLVELYYKWNRLDDVKITLDLYMAMNPQNPYSYAELMTFYLNQKKLNDAFAILEKTRLNKIKNDQSIDIAYAKYFQETGEYLKVEKRLLKTCNAGKKPKEQNKFSDWLVRAGKKFENEECYYRLAESYYYQKKYNQAVEVLGDYLETGRKIFSGSELLRRVYEAMGEKEKAEELLKSTLTSNQRLGEYFALADYYKINSKTNEQKNIYDLAQKTFVNTLYNFKKIHELGNSYGVKIVFMQYPTFDLEFLKYFTGNLRDVDYIDNQHIFDDRPRIQYLFEARYPYNFNHYTIDGSMVLANNIAENIIKIILKGNK
jgi:tetratricopeptide (TPR) repeat protein